MYLIAAEACGENPVSVVDCFPSGRCGLWMMMTHWCRIPGGKLCHTVSHHTSGRRPSVL